MNTKITIIGLHQVGVSIAMALLQYKAKITCIGYDQDRAQKEKAGEAKAFARIDTGLKKTLTDADIIVLAIPADQVEEMMTLCSPSLKDGATVINTSLWHQGIDETAQKILPAGVQFISATPILNPKYLIEGNAGLDEPHADLFKQGALLICCTPETHQIAIRTCADLAELLGTHAYFTDPLEADALMADVETLPKLVSAALVNAAVHSPAWNDSSRLAGSSFLTGTSALQQLAETQDMGKILLQSRAEVLHSLDRVIEALVQLRKAIDQKDSEQFNSLLANAQVKRADWFAYRSNLDWNTANGVPEKGQRDVPERTLWTQKRK